MKGGIDYRNVDRRVEFRHLLHFATDYPTTKFSSKVFIVVVVVAVVVIVVVVVGQL